MLSSKAYCGTQRVTVLNFAHSQFWSQTQSPAAVEAALTSGAQPLLGPMLGFAVVARTFTQHLAGLPTEVKRICEAPVNLTITL